MRNQILIGNGTLVCLRSTCKGYLACASVYRYVVQSYGLVYLVVAVWFWTLTLRLQYAPWPNLSFPFHIVNLPNAWKNNTTPRTSTIIHQHPPTSRNFCDLCSTMQKIDRQIPLISPLSVCLGGHVIEFTHLNSHTCTVFRSLP